MAAAVLCAVSWLQPAVAQRSGESDQPAAAAAADELARLQAMLGQPGPDGKEARETAVERLVAWPTAEGHAVLQAILVRSEDPDGVRLAVLSALQRHLLGAPGQLFGGADEAARRPILRGYVSALAPLWRSAEARTEEATANPLRSGARLALQRMPARELEVVLQELLPAASADEQIAILRCFADLQQLLFAKILADFVESPDSAVRAAARQSLQLLTFHGEEFTTKAQFAAWFEQFGSMRYVDLAERAARSLPLRLERLRQELNRRIVDSAVEFVRAHTTRTPGLAWQAIGERTLVDDPAVLDACLEQLQKALGDRLPQDDDAAARQAFCRGLLARWRLVAPDQLRRRGLLLEVASYCVKPEDAELATEVVSMLSAQLEQPSLEARQSALRGIRRFPSAEARARLVRHAAALVAAPAASKSELEAVLATLASRASPRWYAPGPNDADRADWLALVRSVCSLTDQPELRSRGLDLALSLDNRDQRLTEVFQLLLDLVADPAQGPQFRSNCLIHLRGWLDQQAIADTLVTKLQELLADPASEVRQKAAESLARLPELTDPRRFDWMTVTIATLRDRLAVEPSLAVLQALVNVVQVYGRQQQAEKAIGALNVVLKGMPMPVPQDQQFRLEPILLALETIAADPNAARGPWLGACDQLLLHGRRPNLRLILQSHGAIELAKEVGSSDGALRERALKAMQIVINTALLKPPRESFSASEDLLKEARDVRTAFGALDPLDESLRLDKPEHRILRLEAELAGGKLQEAAQRAQSWLNATNGRVTMTTEQTTAIRMLAAEAQLGLAKPELAAALLREREVAPVPPYGLLDLQCRIARALVMSNPKGAADLFEKSLRATPSEDPAFRSRLLEWAKAQIGVEPASKAGTVAELERHAALFEAADCPQEQRDAFQQLRGQR